MPTLMPPAWDREKWLSSIGKMKKVDYASLCIGHFGCLQGEEARTLMDRAVETFERWWAVFEKNNSRITDVDFLLAEVKREIKPSVPPFRLMSWPRNLAVKMLPAQKLEALVDKSLFRDYIKWVAAAYQGYAANAAGR
jgi:hypothetical protein